MVAETLVAEKEDERRSHRTGALPVQLGHGGCLLPEQQHSHQRQQHLHVGEMWGIGGWQTLCGPWGGRGMFYNLSRGAVPRADSGDVSASPPSAGGPPSAGAVPRAADRRPSPPSPSLVPTRLWPRSGAEDPFHRVTGRTSRI